MISGNDIQAYNEKCRTLVKADGFIYLLPHEALKNWISNYTITFPCEGMVADNYTIIPHGCATLVFSFDGNRIVGDLFGPATKPTCVGRAAAHSLLLFIVEFQPAGYYAFSGMAQNELTDRVIDFDMINPTLNRLLTQKIEMASDIYMIIAEMDRLFLAHLKIAFYSNEFSLANKMIIDSGGRVSVKGLSQNIHFSERHLGRIFNEYMGVNTKAFSRLVRVNKAIRLLRSAHCSITQAYLQTGYYDMPHFIHDFKSICGITPQAYLDNLSDFYSEIAKF